MELGEELKARARELGAAGAGICAISALPQNMSSMQKMLPECQSVVCIMFPHSGTALASPDIYLKQYDTIFCYTEVSRISHQLARYLETREYQAVAVPAFVPLDMSDGKMGMTGAIDWKQAAVESGLAVWGNNGLAVNPRLGSRTRLGGIITTAILKPDKKIAYSPCSNCQLCVESCPAGALFGNGKIDKKRCGDHIFAYGLRAFTRLLVDVAKAVDEENAREAIYSRRTRELWQSLETGNYYSCWTCQNCCPAGENPPDNR